MVLTTQIVKERKKKGVETILVDYKQEKMVSEKSQVKTAVKELEKELKTARSNYDSVKDVLDAHNEERSKIGERYGKAQDRVKELEAAISTLLTLTK